MSFAQIQTSFEFQLIDSISFCEFSRRDDNFVVYLSAKITY